MCIADILACAAQGESPFGLAACSCRSRAALVSAGHPASYAPRKGQCQHALSACTSRRTPHGWVGMQLPQCDCLQFYPCSCGPHGSCGGLHIIICLKAGKTPFPCISRYEELSKGKTGIGCLSRVVPVPMSLLMSSPSLVSSVPLAPLLNVPRHALLRWARTAHFLSESTGMHGHDPV